MQELGPTFCGEVHYSLMCNDSKTVNYESFAKPTRASYASQNL